MRDDAFPLGIGPSPAPRFRQTIVYPFPLAGGYLCQFLVPRDLTMTEADRICAFAHSLVAPASPQAGSQPEGT